MQARRLKAARNFDLDDDDDSSDEEEQLGPDDDEDFPVVKKAAVRERPVSLPTWISGVTSIHESQCCAQTQTEKQGEPAWLLCVGLLQGPVAGFDRDEVDAGKDEEEIAVGEAEEEEEEE